MAKTTRKDGLVEKKITLKDSFGNTIRDMDGKPIRKSFYGKTSKEINKAIDLYRFELTVGHKERQLVYFNDYADLWLSIKKGQVSSGTYRTYERIVNRLKKHFKGHLVDNISQLMVQGFFNTLSGYTKNYIEKFKIVTSAIFTSASVNGLIDKSPCIQIRPPKVVKPAEKIEPYSKEERAIIISESKKDIRGLGAFIQLKLGLRPGEMLSLDYDRDLDMKDMIAHITTALKSGDERHEIGLPKSEAGIRDVAFDKEFREHLESLNLKGKGLIVRSTKGKPLAYNQYLSNLYIPFMKTLDVPYKTPHKLRHTYGTLLYEDGLDLYSIAEIMGHEEIETTTIYVHHSGRKAQKKLRQIYDTY